ncbi:MAG: lysophospholipid acyltransferase family protein [Burkholderiales bacterium]|nr:lysophospholipid acyltransferase family protein [Burkholderiales bacterium]
MISAIREALLRQRIALARLQLVSQDTPSALAQFTQSVRIAFPALSDRETGSLYARYRLSMRKFGLLKNHLSALDEGQLSRFLDRHVDVEGQEHLDAVKADKAPVIFVTPHYGNFPAGCLKLIKEIGRTKTINAFYNPPSKNRSSEGFEELFHGLGYGFNALFNDETAVLKALRVLKRGEALTMMPDVFDISGHVLYVPFFGRLIPAMAGTALFALKSRATIIVGYNCPGEGLKSTLKLGKPLVFERSGKLDEDIAALTAAIFRELEAQIRQSPEHWIYLRGIGDLLGGRLILGTGQTDDWLAALDAATSQIDAMLPDWPDALREIKAMHSTENRRRSAASQLLPTPHKAYS